jgi:hypothetical protein
VAAFQAERLANGVLKYKERKLCGKILTNLFPQIRENKILSEDKLYE